MEQGSERETNPNSYSPLFRNYLMLIVVAGTIILLDQWTKGLVRANLSSGETWMPWPWLAPYARVVNWHNTGSALGLFQEYGGIFAILAILVSALIIYYFPRIDSDDWPLRLAMSLQLGGAIGNLIDRLNFGYVTDYVSIGTFPVFNVADASITGGVLVLLFYTWRGERQAHRETAAYEEEHASGSS